MSKRLLYYDVTSTSSTLLDTVHYIYIHRNGLNALRFIPIVKFRRSVLKYTRLSSVKKCVLPSAQHTLLAPGDTSRRGRIWQALLDLPRALLLPLCLTPLQLIRRKTRGASRAIHHDRPLEDCDRGNSRVMRHVCFSFWARFVCMRGIFVAFLVAVNIPPCTHAALDIPFRFGTLLRRAQLHPGSPECTSRCLCVRAGNFRAGRRSCKCRMSAEPQLPSAGRVPALWSRARWMEPLARSW